MTFADIKDIVNKATIETYDKGVVYEPLFTMSAHIYITKNFVILQSYQAIIAIYDNRDSTFYDFLNVAWGKRTNSSVRHMKMLFSLLEQMEQKSIDYILIEK